MFGIAGELLCFEDNGNYFYKLGRIGAGSRLEKSGFKVGDVIVGVNSFIIESEATKAELENPKITKLTQSVDDTDRLLIGLGDMHFVTPKEDRMVWSDTILQNLIKEKLITPEQKKEVKNKNVLLKVLRYNEKKKAFERFYAPVAKEFFDVPSVCSRLEDDNIGHIRLRKFDLGAGDAFEAELNKVLKRDVKGLIIDLRFNLGGADDECNKIISMFIKKGEIYKDVGKNGSKIFSITKDNSKTNIPIVVLVNETSISCSEEFAVVMQTHKRGTVIGTRTFGKGVGQGGYLFPSDEVTLRFTTLEWFAMPENISINKVGVTPDIEISGPDLNSPEFGDPKQDPQLAAAIKYLRENMFSK
ncbi:hypothetical protein FACS1894198_0070 [Clostridia bacterium]|nr:hypothetical protein FACS1894198_0070 [Clostridia bacterium]